jgi:pyrophosphatase PpaX
VRAVDTVLFDLDGTLIDSVGLIRESHRHAVRSVLGADLPDEVLVANVGRPLIDQMRAFSSDRAEELLHAYRTWNHANTSALLRPYPEIEGLLDELRAGGQSLGIVTSKSRPTVDLAFAVLPLEPYFDVVVTSEDTDRHKPDPAPVRFALERLGALPERSCYVGDAPFDLRAARAAGVAAIAVTWGFFSRAALEPEQPDLVVDRIDQLRDALLGAPAL